jgi:hypothetical protein
MSIIVALFVGLVISAEEIIRDLKIMKRESFLNLSKSSYLNAKIIFLLLLSLIQSFLFVLISCSILQFKGFFFPFWFTLFSLSFLANITGLNISSGFKSVVTIYIIIPLILVPQILLAGVFVKFDKLHPSIASESQVPFVGDLMASRWALEALLVRQFKNNKFQKQFYSIEKNISEASFILNYKLPHLNIIISEVQHNLDSAKLPNASKIALLNSEIAKIIKAYNLSEPEFLVSLTPPKANIKMLKSAENYIYNLKYRFSNHVESLIKEKDSIYYHLIKTMGEKEFRQLKMDYSNERINEFVLNNKEMHRIRVTRNRLIQLYEPVYLDPASTFGRAHFYAPNKRIGQLEMDTFYFNLMIIWILIILMYIALLKSWLIKLMNFKFKFRTKKGLIVSFFRTK